MTPNELTQTLATYQQKYRELEYLDDRFTPKSPMISDTPKIASKANKDQQIINMMTRKDELLNDLNKIYTIVMMLKPISDLHYSILMYKFIGYYDTVDNEHKWLTLEDISQMKGYSLRHMQRLYKEAKKELSDILTAKGY